MELGTILRTLTNLTYCLYSYYDSEKPVSEKNNPAEQLLKAIKMSGVDRETYQRCLKDAQKYIANHSIAQVLSDKVGSRISELERAIRENMTIEDVHRLGNNSNVLDGIFEPAKTKK